MSSTVILGRDGLISNGDRNDFGRWVAYAQAHASELGTSASVVARSPSDVQTDTAEGGTPEELDIITNVLADMWRQWVAAGKP